MITIKNVSNKECIDLLKNWFHSKNKIKTIYLITDKDRGVIEFDPDEMKKKFTQAEESLTDDLHAIMEYIQNGLDNLWLQKPIDNQSLTVFKLYLIMEVLQMMRYKNPGFNPDHPTIILCQLKNDETGDIHSQIIGSSLYHPSHPNFFNFFKSSINNFFWYH